MCSDGAGRTGVYLALDFILEKLPNETHIDIMHTIRRLRQCRPHMVSNPVHLRSLFEIIIYHMACGTTVVPISELSNKIESMAERDPVTKLTGFEAEFKVEVKRDKSMN